MEEMKLKPKLVYRPTLSTEDCDVLISCSDFKCGGDAVYMYPADRVDEVIENLTKWHECVNGKPGKDYKGQDWVLVKVKDRATGDVFIPRVAEYIESRGQWVFIDREDEDDYLPNCVVIGWRQIE